MGLTQVGDFLDFFFFFFCGEEANSFKVNLMEIHMLGAKYRSARS